MDGKISGIFNILKALGGFRTSGPTAYLKKGRLEDVIALIQVLALDKDSRRSEAGLKAELQGRPQSANKWTDMAKEHTEFFRVSIKDDCPVSLVSRYVAVNKKEGRGPLSNESMQNLFTTALDIYDRQVKRADRWISLVPIWAAVISGMLLFATTFILDSSKSDANKVYKVQIVKEPIINDISPQPVSPSTAKDK